jgi:hypothetical protein
MTWLSVALPLLLGVWILITEVRRGQVPGMVDSLRGASAFFFVSFALAPVYLAFAPIGDSSQWAWVRSGSSDERVQASLASILCYGAMVVAYFRFARLGSGVKAIRRPSVLGSVSSRTAWRVGIICTGAGVAAFVVYAWDAGGIITVLQNSMIMRVVGDEYLVSRFAFLKNASLVTIAGSYLLMGAQLDPLGRPRVKRVIVWLSYAASLVILYHLAGRLLMILYLSVFAMVRPYIGKRMGAIRTAGLVAIGLAIAILGKQIFNFYIYREGLGAQMDRVWYETADVLSALTLEFSFPYGNLCAFVKHVPSDLPYRWFLDVPVSLISLLPDSLLGLDLPNSASRDYSLWQGFGIGTELPVDLVSFGYLSLGVLGIVIVGYAFGTALRVADETLSWWSPVVVPLRIAWVQFLATRVMYGDPSHGAVSGFGLVACTALVIVWARLAGAPGRVPNRRAATRRPLTYRRTGA